jgi:hypothetical protein
MIALFAEGTLMLAKLPWYALAALLLCRSRCSCRARRRTAGSARRDPVCLRARCSADSGCRRLDRTRWLTFFPSWRICRAEETLARCLARLPVAALAAADNFAVDPLHSSVNFTVDHLGLTNIYGRFNKFTGTYSVDKAAKTGSLDATVDTVSVDTNENDKAAARARATSTCARPISSMRRVPEDDVQEHQGRVQRRQSVVDRRQPHAPGRDATR